MCEHSFQSASCCSYYWLFTLISRAYTIVDTNFWSLYSLSIYMYLAHFNSSVSIRITRVTASLSSIPTQYLPVITSSSALPHLVCMLQAYQVHLQITSAQVFLLACLDRKDLDLTNSIAFMIKTVPVRMLPNDDGFYLKRFISILDVYFLKSVFICCSPSFSLWKRS